MRSSEFSDVFAYIDANLDEDLSLERLSHVARASKFHFHHRFSKQFGVSLHRYVKLARLRRAAYQLAFRPRLRVIEVTLASGYETPEASARAFKKVVGCSPSAFRASPDWKAWGALNQSVVELRGSVAGAAVEQGVRIVQVPAVRVAALELRRQPLRLADALRRFITWRMENGLPHGPSATFTVFPDRDAPEFIDLCASTQQRVRSNSLGVVEKVLPGGRCAVLRHVGMYTSLFERAKWLATEWLASSGELLRPGPLIIRRITLFPDVAADSAESEITLPVA